MPELLNVTKLSARFDGAPASPVLDEVSFHIDRGEILALVGESGSGKSMTALSLMRLLPRGAQMNAGAITLDGVDLLGLSDRAMNKVRGGRIGALFQQPKRMLDPTSTVGAQVAEPLRRYLGMNRHSARQAAVDLLADVGIAEPDRRSRSYAHQLSGGIAQRVMIAIALAGQPQLLIADEPTTALDVTIEAQILALIAAKRQQLGMSVLFISHDLGVVSAVADRIAVMYAGRIVEEGTTADILAAPEHPYTQALINASMLKTTASGELYAIPGNATSARDLSAGCRFRSRCSVAATAHVEHQCATTEPDLTAGRHEPHEPHEHSTRCWAPIHLGESA